MKLYTYDPAPSPRRLALFMNYKGIEIDTEQVDLGPARQQHSDEFIAINPLRTVPALVTEEGEVLTEVIAQCIYLEALYPDKPLLGSSPLQTAQIINWVHRLFISGYSAIAEAFRNGNPAFAGRAVSGAGKVEQIPELVDRGLLQLEAFWKTMEEHLGGSTWVAGEAFSLADIDLFCIIEFAGWIKQGIPEDCASLKAWQERASLELA